MIIEIADLRIQPGQQTAFEQAIHRAATTVLPRAPGFIGYSVCHGIEDPERYVLQIHWVTLENHTVDFRGGELFSEWRAIIGPYFAVPPVVEHFVVSQAA